MTDPRIVVALDFSDAACAFAPNARLTPQRCRTPRGAIEAGASSHLVVGRPVTRASDPRAALQRINEKILEAERAG